MIEQNLLALFFFYHQNLTMRDGEIYFDKNVRRAKTPAMENN